MKPRVKSASTGGMKNEAGAQPRVWKKVELTNSRDIF